MSRRHVATPEVPDTLLDWQGVLFSAIKENVELLTGTRGEGDLSSMAICRGDFTVNPMGTQLMNAINTSHNVTPNALNKAAPLDAFLDLRSDVQTLAVDVRETRAVLNLLIQNIKGA
jgi:hypothetical protein